MPTLRDLRERAMLSQSELAKLCEVATNTVYFWESGRSKPRPQQQRRLVQSLHCTPEELFTALQDTRKERQQKEGEEKERPAA